MQSKTSCFNKTIYKKNLTRFAPVWVVYTLCLILGTLLLYNNGGIHKAFHFPRHFMQDLPQVLALVQLCYALLVAQLLFGDLYNARMSNMLHAFPITRESWFVTNMVTGLTVSLIPTAIMALVAAPLLASGMFENAMMLAFWEFLLCNLDFICFFGIASFATMVTANRFTTIAAYGLLNSGAMIAYWLVNTVYTPMLDGVVTPSTLAENLTPLNHMMASHFDYGNEWAYELQQKYGANWMDVRLPYTLEDSWSALWILAGVGIVFALVALVLYRKRDLECAGDAVAFPQLVPVFEVLCAIFVATASQYLLTQYLSITDQNWPILIVGLAVGWFIAKMLVERTTHVFRLKNFRGLALLAAAFGLTLLLTAVDVLGIETYIPAASKVQSVTLYCQGISTTEFTKPQDIENMLAIHADGIENHAEQDGTYVQGYDGSWVMLYGDKSLYDTEDPNLPRTYAQHIRLIYILQNGKMVSRYYDIWTEGKAGSILKDYGNDWTYLNNATFTLNDVKCNRLEWILDHFSYIESQYSYDTYRSDRDRPEELKDKANAEAFVEAVKLDAKEGHMAQNYAYHTGYFYRENEDYSSGYQVTNSFYVELNGSDGRDGTSWYIDVYPDSAHAIQWLKDNDLLGDWTIYHTPIPLNYYY